MKNIDAVNKQDPDFWNYARQVYYVRDDSDKQIVGGYSRSSSKVPFTFLTVPKAGHFVSTTYLKPTK
jgi:hypothetical protein